MYRAVEEHDEPTGVLIGSEIPMCIDCIKHIYRIHAEPPIDAFVGIYVQRTAVELLGYYIGIERWVPEKSARIKAMVDPLRGLFRLSRTPEGPVTCDYWI